MYIHEWYKLISENTIAPLLEVTLMLKVVVLYIMY